MWILADPFCNIWEGLTLTVSTSSKLARKVSLSTRVGVDEPVIENGKWKKHYECWNICFVLQQLSPECGCMPPPASPPKIIMMVIGEHYVTNSEISRDSYIWYVQLPNFSKTRMEIKNTLANRMHSQNELQTTTWHVHTIIPPTHLRPCPLPSS